MTQRSPVGSAVGTLTFRQLRVNHFLYTRYLVVGPERVRVHDLIRDYDAQSLCNWAVNEETLGSSLNCQSIWRMRIMWPCVALIVC